MNWEVVALRKTVRISSAQGGSGGRAAGLGAAEGTGGVAVNLQGP